MKENTELLDEFKEARRKKSLGELGELFALKTLVDNSFDKIRNLNDLKMNEKFADILCEKENIRYAISVKARNMYQADGKLNARYNLGDDLYSKTQYIKEKYDALPYWMAVQFDRFEYSVYFGSVESLNGSKGIPIIKCMKGEAGIIFVNKKRHYFDFDFYSNRIKYEANI